jgi:hypothetical protein
MAAPVGAYQWARFTKEVTYGVFFGTTSTPDASSTNFFVEFQDENGLNFATKPVVQTTKAAVQNRRRRTTGRKKNVTGRMMTKLFPELAINLVPWLCTPTLVSGKYVLPSYTVDWMDGLVVRRILGVFAEQGTFRCDNATDWAMLDLTLRAKKEDTFVPTLTEPALTVYPTIPAYEFTDTAGFTILGANNPLTQGYKSLSVTWRNLLDPQFDQFTFLNTCDYCGREIDVEIVPERWDDAQRVIYEAHSAQRLLVKWAITTPSAHNVTLDFNAQNFTDDMTIDRKFTGKQYQTLRFQVHEDMTAGSDAVASVA